MLISRRRDFFGAPRGFWRWLRPPGLRAADLPDLSIKEVKAYVLKRQGGGNTRIASVVTAGGIEGNYTLGARYWHPNLEQTRAGWSSRGRGAQRQERARSSGPHFAMGTGAAPAWARVPTLRPSTIACGTSWARPWGCRCICILGPIMIA